MTVSEATGRPLIRVGPAGWSYPDWAGRVYPRPQPAGFHALPYLARYVDCVEVNATFYALPQVAHVARWVQLVRNRPAFRFLAKLHREFTHARWDDVPRAHAGAFRAAIAPLVETERLSALLAQFAWFFRYDEAGRERLSRLADMFRGLPVVVELRHRSWFGEAGLDFLRRTGLGLAHIDLPSARDHPPPHHASVGHIGYVRLHGRNASTWFDGKAGRDQRYDYLYRADELEGIVTRLREVAGRSTETFLVTNNHYRGQAMANALEVRCMLDGHPPLAPVTLREAYPHLAKTTRQEGQQTLF